MNKREVKKESGFGIIEIIITLGLISVIVVSIGNLLDSVGKLNTTSLGQSKAADYAEARLELINDLKNELFACRCSQDTCDITTCTRTVGSDVQTCDLVPGYTSCWTEYPKSFYGFQDFYLKKVGNDWVLDANTPEVISGEQNYFSTTTITNVKVNASGQIEETTDNYDMKMIIVKVGWVNRGRNMEYTVKSIVTAWEKL